MKTLSLTAAALLIATGGAFAGSDHFGSQAANPPYTTSFPTNTNHDYQPTRKVYNTQSQIDPMTSSSIGTSDRAFPKNSNHDYQPTNVQPQFRH